MTDWELTARFLAGVAFGCFGTLGYIWLEARLTRLWRK